LQKRAEHDGREVIWQVVIQRSSYKNQSKSRALYKARCKVEKAKAQHVSAAVNAQYPERLPLCA
jgi:IS5 family transposase